MVSSSHQDCDHEVLGSLRVSLWHIQQVQWNMIQAIHDVAGEMPDGRTGSPSILQISTAACPNFLLPSLHLPCLSFSRLEVQMKSQAGCLDLRRRSNQELQTRSALHLLTWQASTQTAAKHVNVIIAFVDIFYNASHDAGCILCASPWTRLGVSFPAPA